MSETAQLAPYADEYRPRFVMAPEDAKALDDQLRASMHAVLRAKVDYDTIPGMGDKPTLLKPGAEKLLQWFGFGFTNDCVEVERDENGVKQGVTYRAVVTKGLPDGRVVTVATCEGYAGYEEDRFFQTDEQARAKARARELYNADRYKRDPRPAKWEHAAGYKAPWNTVIKMAQKRALVGAAIDATAAAGLFTQDLEDMPRPAAADGDAAAVGEVPPGGDWDSFTTERPGQQQEKEAGRWVDDALARAAGFKTEAEAGKLWREAAAAVLDGRATPGEATHVQNLIDARVLDRRKQAATRILKGVAEDDPWRVKILDELESAEDASAAVAELEQLAGAGQLDQDRARLFARAVIARFPKAAVKTGGDQGA